jgi:hypothetical protein
MTDTLPNTEDELIKLRNLKGDEYRELLPLTASTPTDKLSKALNILTDFVNINNKFIQIAKTPSDKQLLLNAIDEINKQKARVQDLLNSSSAIPSGTTNRAPDQIPSTMSELEALYEQKEEAYQTLVFSVDANMKLPEIRRLNQELGDILNAMLEIVATTKQSSGNLSAVQQDLLAKLQKIENDALKLKKDTDAVETLRRIRADEESRFSSSLYFYIGAVLVVALLILLVMFVFSGKKSEASTPMPMSPSTTPPLM